MPESVAKCDEYPADQQEQSNHHYAIEEHHLIAANVCGVEEWIGVEADQYTTNQSIGEIGMS